MAKKRRTPEDWAWDCAEVGGIPKLVLVCIARHADWDDFTSYPKATTLANECGVSRRMVFKALEELERCNLVQRFPIYSRNEQRPSLYLLNCHDLDEWAWTSARQVLESRILAGQVRRGGEVLQTTARFSPNRQSLPRPRTDQELLAQQERLRIEQELRESGPGLKRLRAVGDE